MIPRFELHADAAELAAWAAIAPTSMPKAEAHVPAHKFSPVLRISPTSHEKEIVWMREGLIPSYACDDHDAQQRAEAHAEAMTCDSCFRSAFRRRRCIVPSQLIHEQRHISTAIGQPCSFALESGEIFGIAAVWETWTNGQGHEVESFAIVTVLAAPLLRALFDRMPVILLERKEQEQWLHVAKPDEPPLNLLKPLTAAELSHWKMMPGPVDLGLQKKQFETLTQ